MLRTRLMNVAQVKGTISGLALDLRATCVEVTQTPDITLAVLWSLFRRDENLPARPIDARVVGRFTLGPEAVLSDPVDGGDGVCWELRVGEVLLTIRPYEGESIWIDPSFGHPEDGPPGSAAALRHQYRATMISAVAHRRMLAQSRSGTPLHVAHAGSLQMIEETAARLRKRLGLPERARS